MKVKKKNRVMVIGGLGFMGRQIANVLSDLNYSVTIVDSAKNKSVRKDQVLKIIDIKDKIALTNAMKGINTVLHFAGIADIGESKKNPELTIENNILGTVSAIESAINQKVKNFIFASTMYVYSDLGSFYRASKQACEIILKAYASEKKFNYTILRYGSLYGPDAQEWNGLYKYVSEIINKGKISYHGTGNERREYIHVSDAARLTADILEKKIQANAVNITGSQVFNSKELLQMIFEIAGKKYKVNFSKKENKNDHYALTPYKYVPDEAYKLTPDRYIDLGQGILDIIEDVKQKK